MTPKMQILFEQLPDLLGGHLTLAVPAIFMGVLISVPLGILCVKSARIRGPVMSLVSLVQTIPSIALLAIMVALLGGTIGYWPAFIALLIYSILPIIRNTIVGLESVDPAMREAAKAVGMRPVQQLLWVELPLALPVILAGVRTATVWVVGIATLSTPVGAPSLGNYIFDNVNASRSFLSQSISDNNVNAINNTTVDFDNTLFTQKRAESDYYVKDASWLKLDNVTIGYLIEAPFNVQSSSLRLYSGVQNVLTISKYKGMDPEVFGGIDSTIYPRARMFLFGLNYNF